MGEGHSTRGRFNSAYKVLGYSIGCIGRLYKSVPDNVWLVPVLKEQPEIPVVGKLVPYDLLPGGIAFNPVPTFSNITEGMCFTNVNDDLFPGCFCYVQGKIRYGAITYTGKRFSDFLFMRRAFLFQITHW